MPLDITINVTVPGATAAVLSGLGFASDLISVTSDTASGPIYYLLHNSVTPLGGPAIKSAVLDLTAVGGGTLDPLETDNQPVDWTGVTPGTYWINMVQDTGVFSNVPTPLEVTIVSASFDPASLPGAEVVVDISDITTLWQGNDGTTQVTASGQTVGSVTNRGSLGGLFVNTGGSAEPTYTEAAGRKQLDFDGSADFLTLTLGTGNFNLSGGFYLWVLAFDDGTSNNFDKAILSMADVGSTAATQHGMRMQIAPFSGGDTYAVRLMAGNNSFVNNLIDTRTTNLPWAIVEFECVPTAADPNGWLRIEKSGDGAPVAIASEGTTGVTPYPDTATATKRMTLGANMQGSGGTVNAQAKCSIAAVVMVSGALTTTDRDAVRAWLRARAAF